MVYRSFPLIGHEVLDRPLNLNLGKDPTRGMSSKSFDVSGSTCPGYVRGRTDVTPTPIPRGV